MSGVCLLSLLSSGVRGEKGDVKYFQASIKISQYVYQNPVTVVWLLFLSHKATVNHICRITHAQSRWIRFTEYWSVKVSRNT